MFKRLKTRFSAEHRAEHILFFALIIAFIADCLYSARILFWPTVGENYNILVELLYGIFSVAISTAFVKCVLAQKKPWTVWGPIGLATLLSALYVTFKFIEFPYYQQPYPLILKINSTIYAIATCLLASVVLPFAFRVLDRRKYWLNQLILFYLTADFAIRYQTSFVTVTAFSWAEFGWCSTFVGLAWLVFLSGEQDILMSKDEPLAPLLSVRCLLTLAICLANSTFFFGSVVFKLSVIKNAVQNFQDGSRAISELGATPGA